MCKFWYENDYGRGLMEVCKLTGRETNCCADIKECECDSIRRENEKDI